MFLSRVKSRYVVQAGEDTYWSCFTFEGQPPSGLHCTHKYFGELDQGAVSDILKTMYSHFDKSPFKPFTVPFVKEDFFGEDKDTRVLRPDDLEGDKEKFFLDLRGKLDKFAEDQHPSYEPHVSTDSLTEVNEPFTGYAFCRGDEILKHWKARK